MLKEKKSDEISFYKKLSSFFSTTTKKKNLSVETEQENIDKNAQNTDSLVEFMLGNDSYKEYIQTKK